MILATARKWTVNSARDRRLFQTDGPATGNALAGNNNGKTFCNVLFVDLTFAASTCCNKLPQTSQSAYEWNEIRIMFDLY